MFKTIILFCFLSSLASCQKRVKIHNTTANVHDTSAVDSSDEYSGIRLTEDEETIIEMYDTEKTKTVSVNNSHIDICHLSLDVSETKMFFISTEIYNNTSDTICFSNNSFMFYDKENHVWRALPYPENFVKEDIGIFIAPHTRQSKRFLLPVRNDSCRGNYKIQLAFYSGKHLYYATKSFTIK